MYPALAGRFLSTMPTEKSKEFFFFFLNDFILSVIHWIAT